MNINMTKDLKIVEVPSKPFLHLEKIGPFMKTAPQAWQEFWQKCGPLMKDLAMDQMAGLSRIDETQVGDEKFIYQAGVFLKTSPKDVPPTLHLRNTQAGKYASFLLTGAYQQLQYAYPNAFEVLKNKNVKLRNEFCVEIYLNTPDTTPEAELKTEILIPIE